MRVCFLLFLLLSFTIFPLVAKADTIEIATLQVVTTEPLPGDFYEQSSLTNLTSVTLDVTGFTELGMDIPETIMVEPGETLQVLTCMGACDETVALFGTLSSLDFSIAGQEYQATTLNWESPAYNEAANGTFSIGATPVPEPPAFSLIACALALCCVITVTYRYARRRPV